MTRRRRSKALRRLAAAALGEPTLFASAVRGTLVAGAGFGLDLDGATIAAFMVALEFWLTWLNRALVTPTAKAKVAEVEAAHQAHGEGYLLGIDDGRKTAVADLAELAPKPRKR